MSNERQPTQMENMGCIVVIGMIVFAVIMPMLIEFIKFLMIVAVFGGIGYVAYKILNDPVWTERFERWFNLDQATLDDGTISEYEQAALESPKIDQLSQELNTVKDQLLDLNTENQRLKGREKEIIRDALDTYGKEVAQQQGKQLLNDVFGETAPDQYNRSNEYEKQEYLRRRQDEEEKLSLQRIELDMDRKLHDMSQTLDERTYKTQQDVLVLRQIIMDGFTAIAKEFLGIHQEITTLKGYVTEKFAQFEVMLTREISSVKELVMGLEQRVYREVGDMKVQFGREVVRLDQQQLQMVGKLQQFNTTVDSFRNDMRRLRMDSERFNMRGEDMLNKVITLNERHKAAMTVQSKELVLGLQKMAVHDQHFAAKVGQARVMLQEKSNDITFALKDMAYERIGINALRDDYQSRDTLAQERLARKRQEIDSIRQTIQLEQRHNRDTSQLQHRLNMANEQQSHLRNMASMMQKEHSIIRRLSQ